MQMSMEIDDRKLEWIEANPFAIGTFGAIYRVIFEGEIVCAKKISLREISGAALESTKKEYTKEVALMSELRSQNIVQIFGSCTRKTELIILMEYCQGGTLRAKLDAHHAGKDTALWGIAEQYKMLRDISYGMDYLHSKKIIHQNLTSANILITSTGKGKVNDFGKSKSNKLSSQMSKKGGTVVGSYCWSAPELIKGEKATEKSDVYSFGIILWEVITCRIPWEGLDDGKIIGKVVFEGQRPVIEETAIVDAQLKKLMEKCWNAETRKRPYFDEIIKMLNSKPIEP